MPAIFASSLTDAWQACTRQLHLSRGHQHGSLLLCHTTSTFEVGTACRPVILGIGVQHLTPAAMRAIVGSVKEQIVAVAPD